MANATIPQHVLILDQLGSATGRLCAVTKMTPEYWATVAQVVPFFAVGLVVEWRGLLSRPAVDLPWYLRAAQGITWAASIVGLGVSELVSLYALEGRDIADWWPLFVSSAIGSSVAVLIFWPAVELIVRTNPELPAVLLSSHPGLRLGEYWRHRVTTRRFADLSKRLAAWREDLAEMEQLLAEAVDAMHLFEDLVADPETEPATPEELAAFERSKAKVEDRHVDYAEARARLEGAEKQYVEKQAEYLASRQSQVERMQAHLVSERKGWEKALRNFGEARQAETEGDDR